MSTAIIAAYEKLSFELQMAKFEEEKHLKEREKQYCIMNTMTRGIFVVRETEDGWWRESIDFKDDPVKQIEKLKNDPTVSLGFLTTQRFNEPGGWYDPT